MQCKYCTARTGGDSEKRYVCVCVCMCVDDAIIEGSPCCSVMGGGCKGTGYKGALLGKGQSDVRAGQMFPLG